MNTFLKRFFYVFIANMSMMTSMSFAATHMPGTYKVGREDVSLQVLEQVFGLVDGILYGTGTQVVGKMFGVFNSAVIALGGIFLTYTLLVSTLNTAQDGEVMGKQWSSIWIPLRVTSGVALLAPKASGYCMMQVFVMWVVVQGIGAANHVWDSALTYLEDGGVLTAVPLVGSQQPVGSKEDDNLNLIDAPKLDQASAMMDSLLCMRALDHAINDWESDVFDSGYHINKRAPDFFDSTNIMQAWNRQVDHSKPLTVSFPNFDEAPYRKLNGICGNVTITPFVFSAADKARIVQNGRADEFEAMQARTQNAVLMGTQQMMDELQKVAVIVTERNEEQLKLYRQGAVTEEDKSDTILNVGDEVASSGGCRGDTCEDWGPPESYLTGYELQTSVLSYYSMVLPFLNQLNRTASQLEFIPDAKRRGWIMAGSYFFDVANLSMKLNQLKPENYFKIKVESKDFNSVARNKLLFQNLQNKFTGGFSMPVDIYEDYIKNNYVGKGHKKRIGRGLQGVWRKNISKDSAVPLDDNFDTLLKDMHERNAPNSIYKPVQYQPFFKFSNVLRMPFSKQERKPCSLTSLGKCLDENIMVGIWNLIVSLIDAIADFINAFFLSPLEKLLDLVLGQLVMNHGLKSMFEQITNVNNHPIINLAHTGQDLMEFTWDSFLLLIGIFLIVSIPAFGFAKIFWDVLGKRIAAILIIILVVFGYSFAFYAPMLPYMMFLFSALAWAVAVIESMVAAPIVALGLTHPEGQNPVFGKAENAIMLIINVFLRPSLMILGYVIAIVLSYAFIIFTAYSFSYVNNHFLGASADHAVMNNLQAFRQQILDSDNAGGANGIIGVLGPIMMMVLFMFIYLEVVKKCFALIHMLPDQILRWLSGGIAEQFGNQVASPVENAVQGAYQQKAENQLLPTPKALDGVDSPMRHHESQLAAQQRQQAGAATSGSTV